MSSGFLRKFYLMLLVWLGFSATSLQAQEWYERIKFKGDFTNRFEFQKFDSNKNASGDVVNRYMERFRLRFGATADLGNDISVTTRLASGESANPIGSFVSFTNAGSKKGIYIDLAYAEYKPNKESRLNGLTVAGGKMINTFYRPGDSGMIWDGDLTPEGAYASYQFSFHETFKSKFLLGGLSVEERSKGADSGMLALESVNYYKPIEKLDLTLGLSYFNFGNIKGRPTIFDATKSYGNSVDATKSYKEDFDLLHVGFEATYNFEFAPIGLFVDFVKNIAADGDLDTGFIVGLKAGAIKGPNSWSISFSYRKVEADATLGIFTDSELGGGGTNTKGFIVNAQYAITKNVIFGVIGNFGDNNLSATSVTMNKIQVDLSYKF